MSKAHYVSTLIILTIITSSSLLLSGCYSTQQAEQFNLPDNPQDLNSSTNNNNSGELDLSQSGDGIDNDVELSSDTFSVTGQVNDDSLLPNNQNNSQNNNLEQENMTNNSQTNESNQNLPTEITNLQVETLQAGSGPAAQEGNNITVHYTGMLTNGEIFDSSYPRKEPFSFQLGVSSVIQGWHQGLQGLQAGGKYRLLIPSELAYGETGRPPVIPANAPLIFDIEIIDIQ